MNQKKLRGEGLIDNHRIVTLIDYSKPSHLTRLWVIDLIKEKSYLYIYSPDPAYELKSDII